MILFNLGWLIYGIIGFVLISREVHSVVVGARFLGFSIATSTFLTILISMGERFTGKRAARCSVEARGLHLNGRLYSWQGASGFNISDNCSIEGAKDLNIKRSFRGKPYWIKASYYPADVDEAALRTLLESRISYVAFPKDGSDPFAFPELSIADVRKSFRSLLDPCLASGACVAIVGALEHFRVNFGLLGGLTALFGLVFFGSTTLLILDAIRTFRMARQEAAAGNAK